MKTKSHPCLCGYFVTASSSPASRSGETVSAWRLPKMTRYFLSETFHRIRISSASFGVTVFP
jgi:hypothetical protein